MDPVKNKKFSEPIIYAVKQTNSTVLAVDKATSVMFLDQQDLDILGGFKAKINHTWYKNRVVSFSPSGSHFAVITEDAKQSRLYDASTKKVNMKINRHHGEVTCVAIDPRGRYFFSGGEDGRTYVSDIKNARLLFTLPTHVDTINDIKFSKKSYLVATASYDKKVQVYNYGTMTPLATFKSHVAPVMKLQFISENLLCSVDKKASAIIWDLGAKKVHKRLTGIHDEVVEMTSNDKFLFLGTALGFVIVYELKNFEQVSRKFVKVSSRITFMDYDEEQELLVIADESGNFSYFDAYFGIDSMKYAMEQASYDKVYSLVIENPLLEYTSAYGTLEDIWNDIYIKASKLLQRAHKDEAKKVFGGFTQIPKKNTLIKKLFNEYSEFDNFLMMVKAKNYANAYSLVNRYPIYKESEVYIAIEKKWQKLFVHAQKLSLDPRAKDKVKEILSPYRGVSDKTKHIQEMLIKSDIYVRFKNSVIKKDFKLVFELIKVNPFLKEFPEYEAIMIFSDNLYIKINKFIQSGDIHQAIKLIKVLVDFPDFKHEANSMLQDIELRDKFYKVVEQSSFIDIYKIIDNSIALSNTSEGMKYVGLWNDDLDLAKVYAINGDILGIDGVLDKYKDISSKYMSIASIYSLGYITQIENAIKLKKDKSSIERAMKSYVLYFGSDDFIKSTFEIFVKKYDGVEIDFDNLKKGSKKSWQISLRVLDILE